MKKLAALLLAVMLLAALCPFAYAAGYTVIVSPQYNMAETFSSNVTKVSKNTKWAIANTSGTEITGFQWEAMGDVTSPYIPAKSGGKWGYVSQKGKVLIPYRYLFAGAFRDGIALVQTVEGKHVYINIYGEELFISPFTYSFSPSEGAICGMNDGVYGYCDTEGNMIISPQFDMAFDFHEGYAGVKFGNKWGFINSYGQYSVKPQYDYVTDFSNGYAICRLSGKYGIINTAGTRICPFQFDYIGLPGDNGYFPAKAGTVSGYINAKGVWQQKTSYDFCYRYTGGVARVYQDGLWGFIDASGNELIAPSFIDLGEYQYERASYSIDGSLWGYLTLNSIVALPKPAVTPDDSQKGTASQQTSTPSGTSGASSSGSAALEQQNPSASEVPPTILNPANDGSRPLDPKSERCISMKIGSKTALKGSLETTVDGAPALINGVTMIPVRSLVELLGGTVAWNAEQKRINISWNHANISLSVGSKIYYAGGVPLYLSATPVNANGVTLVPLRDISTALNCKVEWVSTQQNIYIYY